MRHLTLLLVFSALPLFAAFPDICVRCWYEVPGSNLSAVYQTPTPPGNTGSASIMKAWNGGAFDARRNRLIVTGGGVTDYAGNEVYAFDVDSLQWYRIKNGSSTYDEDDTLYAYYRNGGSQPDSQQPRPGSNYDQMEYDSLSDNLYIFGAPFAYKHSTMWKNIFQLNLGTLTWSRPGQVTSNIDFGGSLSARDPATGKIWIFGNGNGAWMSSFHPGTGTLTDHGDYWTGADIPSSQTAAVMPPRNRVVSVGAGSALYWNIVTSGNTYTQTLATTGCDSLQAAYAPGFEWSPVDGKMVGWVKGSHVVTMDTSYTCTDVAPSGSNTVTPNAPQANGTYGRWRYVPKYNVFILVNSTTGSVYFYRHSAEPPVVTEDPEGDAVHVGDSITFDVEVTGTQPLHYQWRKSGDDIPGATSATYTTPPLTLDDDGARYSVIVTNVAGVDTSNTASITVSPVPVPPAITTQPSSQTVAAGNPVTFSVVATGVPAPVYQWRRNNVSISGATSSSYTISSTVLGDDGAEFKAEIANSSGTIYSNVATLTVIDDPPPVVVITSPAQDTTVHEASFLVLFTVDGAERSRLVALDPGLNTVIIDTLDVASQRGADTVLITFTTRAGSLTALPSATPDSGLAPLTVRFRTDGVDSISTIDYFRWDFHGDGLWEVHDQVARDYSITYDVPGIYYAALEAVNSLGQADTALVRIVVTSAPPKAFAKAVPSNGPTPLGMVFQGWGTKQRGYIRNHQYDFDGNGTYDTTLAITQDTTLIAGYDFESGLQGWTPGGDSGTLDRTVTAPDSVFTTNQGFNYRDSLNMWIASPPIALDTTHPCSLSFWHVFEGEMITDTGVVEIDTGGTSAVPLAAYLDRLPAGRVNLSLAAFAGKTVRVRFRFHSDQSNHDFGWRIDSVLVFSTSGGVRDSLFLDEVDGTVNWTRNPLEKGRRWETRLKPGHDHVLGGRKWIEVAAPQRAPFADSAWGTSTGVEYFDDMNAWILSPPIALDAVAPCSLFYWNRYYSWDDYDGGKVEIDSGDGVYRLLETITTFYERTEEYTRTLSLGAYAGKTVRLRFLFTSNEAAPYGFGWEVDSILVFKAAGQYRIPIFRDADHNASAWTRNSTGATWVRKARTGMAPEIRSTYPSGLDAWITSPKVYLAPGSSYRLAFRQFLSLADSGDGLRVEVASNGGGFSALAPVGGYPGTITGEGAGFTRIQGVSRPVFNLSSFAGDSVRIRMRFFSDGSGSDRGMLLDDVSLFALSPFDSLLPGDTTWVAHTYTGAATYPARFRVQDNEGQYGLATALSTEIRVGAAGTPSVASTASPASGNTPLAVTFTASATDPGGSIALYEWDFDGNGTYDWSSTSTGNTSQTYGIGGAFLAKVRVTDNSGFTATESHLIQAEVQATLAIVQSGRTFNPYASQTITVRTTLSGQAHATVLLRDKAGATVRTLVSATQRSSGTYDDVWDGRNDTGDLLPVGAYYAVLQFPIGSETRTVDPTHTTGGVAYNPSRTAHDGYQISPLENEFLPIDFTLAQPAEVTVFTGLLWGSNLRLRTLFNREPLGAGTYTFYWDGVTDDGRIPREHSGDIIPGLWGYTLPDNAVWLKASPPEISSLSSGPGFFAPMGEACGSSGEENGVAINYSLSASAAKVVRRIYDAETGLVVKEDQWLSVGSGAHSLLWDGRNQQGKSVDEGIYRIGFAAFDSNGNRGLWKYNLVRTLFSFQPPEAP